MTVTDFSVPFVEYQSASFGLLSLQTNCLKLALYLATGVYAPASSSKEKPSPAAPIDHQAGTSGGLSLNGLSANGGSFIDLRVQNLHTSLNGLGYSNVAQGLLNGPGGGGGHVLWMGILLIFFIKGYLCPRARGSIASLISLIRHGYICPARNILAGFFIGFFSRIPALGKRLWYGYYVL